MPNKPGVCSRFDFQESAGVNRTAWLTSTKVEFSGDVPLPIHIHVQSTQDSKWMVFVPQENRQGGPFDRLRYLGTDGTQWTAQVHCEYQPGSDPPPDKARADYIFVWVTNEREDRTKKTDKDRGMLIFDWDGSAWRVELDHVYAHEGTPKITLSRYQG